MKTLAIYGTAFVLIALLTYGGWHIARWWNWNMGYQSDVTETICEMIKPEYLINPTKCN